MDQKILEKIKFLLNLSKSSNENEAQNALNSANKLMEKFNVTLEDIEALDEVPEAFEESQILYKSNKQIPWKAQLALLIAQNFDCFVAQEYEGTLDTVHNLTYFVIGEPFDIKNVKLIFDRFCAKIEEKIKYPELKFSYSRNTDDSVSSYTEGIILGISSSFDFSFLKTFKKKINKVKAEKAEKEQSTDMVPENEVKDPKIKEKVDVRNGVLIKDIRAYYLGVNEGSQLADTFYDEAENVLTYVVKELGV